MAQKFMEIVLTPSVQQTQDLYYGRHQSVAKETPQDLLGENEQAFIRARNSFYMATVNQDGWPYIQHRGGPIGFLKVINPSLIAFADFKGNRQLISAGNLTHNNRVSLFLIDYPSRTRLKILGTARIYKKSEASVEIADAMEGIESQRVERLFAIDVISFDWNCPQYITQRYSHEEIAPVIESLKTRIQELENAQAS